MPKQLFQHQPRTTQHTTYMYFQYQSTIAYSTYCSIWTDLQTMQWMWTHYNLLQNFVSNSLLSFSIRRYRYHNQTWLNCNMLSNYSLQMWWCSLWHTHHEVELLNPQNCSLVWYLIFTTLKITIRSMRARAWQNHFAVLSRATSRLKNQWIALDLWLVSCWHYLWQCSNHKSRHQTGFDNGLY